MVIWLNGTVGSGKSAVGQALAGLMASCVYRDGDDLAGPPDRPNPVRWRRALDALLREAAHSRRERRVVFAYPLDRFGYQKLRAVCTRAKRTLLVVNLATPLPITLRGRGGRRLDGPEQARVRVMRSEGYHRRPFAAVTLPNVVRPVRTARAILRLSQRHPHASVLKACGAGH